MSDRSAFLARVQRAVIEGNAAGSAAPLPDRGGVGYKGGGPDLLASFLERCQAVGMKPAVVASREELLAKISAILQEKNSRRVLLGRGRLMDGLDLAPWLTSGGREVVLAGAATKDALFSADLGISEVASLIAETGSLVIGTTPEMSRTESLLPPVHIAIARADRIYPDVFDVLEKYSADRIPPSNLVFITGPSKTGDIEMKLVTGVHGPGEVYVFVCRSGFPA